MRSTCISIFISSSLGSLSTTAYCPPPLDNTVEQEESFEEMQIKFVLMEQQARETYKEEQNRIKASMG